MRRFLGIELGEVRIPDEITLLNFRHLLERHGLTEALFAEVNRHLADQGIRLRPDTLVDATIIDAPSSTMNENIARDPDMSSTKKGATSYFAMKAHVGVDVESRVSARSATTSIDPERSRAPIWRSFRAGRQAVSSRFTAPIGEPTMRFDHYRIGGNRRWAITAPSYFNRRDRSV